MLKNSLKNYGIITKITHGLLAIGVIAEITLALIRKIIPNKAIHAQLITLHKGLGLFILAIGIFFILWKWINVKPLWPSDMPFWERLSAKVVHNLLILSLLIMPLTGWIGSTAKGHPPVIVFPIPAPFIHTDTVFGKFLLHQHETLGLIVLGIIIIHILAALKHHFIDRDKILKNMLP